MERRLITHLSAEMVGESLVRVQHGQHGTLESAHHSRTSSRSSSAQRAQRHVEDGTTHTSLAYPQLLVSRRTGRLVQVLQLPLLIRLLRFESIDRRELLHRFLDFSGFSQRFHLFRAALNGELNLSNFFHLRVSVIRA